MYIYAALLTEVSMITGPICKAARALVEIDRRRLAKTVGVSEHAMADFESGGDKLPESKLEAIVKALEEFGAILIPEDGALGAGVRLKFSRSVTDRIEDLENEGGPARPDDVP
jgi:DNA-binding XRE family transcriptional regulator